MTTQRDFNIEVDVAQLYSLRNITVSDQSSVLAQRVFFNLKELIFKNLLSEETQL